MRLLVYSQDSMGLGHLRRTRNVAEELLARAPDSSILVLADSPAAPFFAQLPGIDHVKLPTIVKTGLAGWRTATLPLDIREVVDLRAKLILSAYRAFRPDAVLIDHMPTGALGELKLTLDHATTGPTRTRLFLGLRDILNAPEEIRRAWGRSGDYEYLQCYDQVLIYGCREIFDAESAYRLEPSAQQVTYCHYVAPRPLASLPPDIPGEPYILVMGGGGGDRRRAGKDLPRGVPGGLPEHPAPGGGAHRP